MPVVHLAGPSEEAAPVPVLVRLGLAELLLLCDRAGHPRLPLDLESRTDAEAPDRLQQRLAGDTPPVGQQARRLVAEAHHRAAEDPEPLAARLAEIGLLDPEGTPVGDLVAALGALASPEALLVLDLAEQRDAGEMRLRSYFSVVGSQVVQLSTVSGLTYELAWFGVAGLADALTRAVTVETSTKESQGPAAEESTGERPTLELPFELFTDGTEAVRRGRDDLLAEVIRLSPGPVKLAGSEISPTRAAQAITELEGSARGRLRVLVTASQGDVSRRRVGLVSWLLTDSGWRELSPRTIGGVPVLEIAPVEPRDLARSVAPVLAQVVR